jgi:hypothetical protein
MPDTNRTLAILIKEDTPLPVNLSIESEAVLPGWRVVKNLDRSTLARNIEGANWNFFYLAGEIRATVLGRDRSGTLRRAVKCVLAKQEGQKFNSLEITKVVSKRFLGIPFMSVTAHSRHIQRSVGLVPAKDLILSMPVAEVPESALASGRKEHHAEVATEQYTALISSSQNFVGDTKMKTLRSSILCLVVLLLTAPLLRAQDLSKYRHFTMGMNLSRALERTDQKMADVKVIHGRPALIQELTWRPPNLPGASFQSDRRTNSPVVLQRRALQDFCDLRSNLNGRAHCGGHGEVHFREIRPGKKCCAGDRLREDRSG